MSDTNDREEGRHPIRVVTERTGLSPDVLRAWERRYGAVQPARGNGGQRLYSDADIHRLTQLARAVHAGRSVASVAGLTSEALALLVTEDADQGVARPTPPQEHRMAAMAAIRDLAPERLEPLLRRSVLSLGTPTFLERVLAPLLTEMGEAWHAGEISIAHEHAASATIDQLLGWLLRELAPTDAAPRLLMATPLGERHGLGALVAAAAAVHDGWRVTWLGTDLPAAQIAAAAARDLPDLVALSVVATTAPDDILAEVLLLRQALDRDIPLLVGGSGASNLPAVGGLTGVRDLTHWHSLLRSNVPPHLALP
jgi:DNA-binding transcriptional MerR regulator/methylmalonyl-CoA mutase cobalamin-binding subunit